MREKVIKKIRFDGTETMWTDGKRTYSYYLVMIDHRYHTIEFEHVGGCAPHYIDVLDFVLNDTDIRKELVWAMEEYHRKYPISFETRCGQSGSMDVALYVSKVKHHWSTAYNRKAMVKLHISCHGKLNEGIPDIFSGDLLDLLWYYWTESGQDCHLIEVLTKTSARKRSAFYRQKGFVYMKNPVKERPTTFRTICGCMTDDTSYEDRFIGWG